MSTKSVTLSSAGLKNLLLNTISEENFVFSFGERQITMNKIFAEFISPLVSRQLQSDLTNNIIYYNNQILQEIVNEETISFLRQLSSGHSINITKEQGDKMRIISIFLDNQELYDKINELYPLEITETNKDEIINRLQLFMNFTPQDKNFHYSEYIEFISSNFYSFDRNKLFDLPKPILNSIISNDKLKIENEDSLLDFIQQLFSTSNDEEPSISIVDFYEHVEFSCLSESKLRSFIENFDFNEMTASLWTKLSQCFYFNYHPNVNTARYSKFCLASEFKFEEDNKFNGIIRYLTNQSGGNVADKSVVDLTCSAIVSNLPPRNVVDLDNENYFQVNSALDGWLKYDFKDKKVYPTHYSMKARPDSKVGSPMNFVVEGSNTDRDCDWTILDTQNNVTYLTEQKSAHTFKINSNQHEFYRYLRIRQTGPNIGGTSFYMSISAIEFFGKLMENKCK